MKALSPSTHVKVKEKLVNRPRNDITRDTVQKGRDEVQDNQLDRRDDRQDCRHEEGVGQDKRESNQNERQDRYKRN